jgi:hypothetical protein
MAIAFEPAGSTWTAAFVDAIRAAALARGDIERRHG